MPDKSLIEKNKQHLLTEKARLQKLLTGIGPEHEELGDKDEDNAVEVELYERNVAEERDLTQQLARISAALLRIENGTYGKCLRGGEEISPDRLEAAPEAENCVEHDG